MDRTELDEYLTETSPTDPYYELLILDFGTSLPAWFACNHCGRNVTNGQGCPDHAPLNVPGLARSECEANPPHAPIWVLDGEQNGYGIPCPSCIYESGREAREYAERCQHWGWRRWSITRKVVGWTYVLGLISGSGTAFGSGRYDHKGCVDLIKVRGSRPYILGASRDTWRCWLRGHRRGEEVGFGFCGKCVPWPCCGSQREAHVVGCREDVCDTRAAEVTA